MKILIGHDRKTRRPVYLPLAALLRHLHLIGYTGSGKTTAILTILFGLLTIPQRRRCVVIIDRLGGFSLDLLRWFSSSFCPASLRRRLLYVEGALEDLVVPMNPLLYGTPAEGYYRVARAVEIVLRGWSAQDISQMPRLARWLFNSFWAVAQLGLTIGDCVHLLRPQSGLHRPLIGALPESLQWEWRQILQAHGSEAERQLESCRNRLTPVFESPALRAMFSSARNYLDVRRWMAEGRVVVINLAPLGKLPETMADMIGSIVVNEVFSVARSLPPAERVDTLLVLDEFQRFVGPDLEFSLAESRQLRTSLVLSHQSFSQLQTAEVDLTSLIFQAQTRLALNVQGFDADLLAQEFASLTYDPLRVKDEIWHRCQRISGHKVIQLQSWNEAEQFARQWGESHGTNWAAHESLARRDGSDQPVRGEGKSRADQDNRSRGGSEGGSRGHGTHEAVLPEYEEYTQLGSRTYYTLEEAKGEWGRKLRRSLTGQGVLRVVNDNELYEVDVMRTAPGHLALDWDEVHKRLPRVVEDHLRMLEENFRQDYFVAPALIERQTQERLQAVLRPRIELHSGDAAQGDGAPEAGGGDRLA